MSINYVEDIYMDLGEKAHMVSLVRPVCGEEIPFEIKAARWELYREDWEKGEVVLEAEGECTGSGHTLDALIQPEMAAKYRFKYIYEVADEIWVDVIRLRVN